jgi:RNA polymerase sigma-70 factor, ECF subfamily
MDRRFSAYQLYPLQTRNTQIKGELHGQLPSAVQETFLRGYRKLEDFDARSNFGTWIYRMAMNCALDVLHKQKSQTVVPIAEEYDSQLPTVRVADGAAGPDRLLLSREIETRRHAAMGKLTPIERIAFVMRHLEERSTEEIAGALGVAPNAAKQAVFRAVKKLRQSLAPLWVSHEALNRRRNDRALLL